MKKVKKQANTFVEKKVSKKAHKKIPSLANPMKKSQFKGKTTSDPRRVASRGEAGR